MSSTIMSLEKLQTDMNVAEFSHCFSIRLSYDVQTQSLMFYCYLMDNNLCTTAELRLGPAACLKDPQCNMCYRKINSTSALMQSS